MEPDSPFVHAVYFWLRPEVSEFEDAAFVQGLRGLLGVASVRYGWVGVPAPTDRPVIERGCSYALALVFDGGAGEEAHQADPAHGRFLEAFGRHCARVLVYDSVAP